MSLRRRFSIVFLVLMIVTLGVAAPVHAIPRPIKVREFMGYDVTRCGAPSGVTYLTYDDAAYSDPLNAVRLADAARSLDVGLGIFHLSNVADAYKQRTGTDIPQALRGRGMYTGNHTIDHPNLTRVSKAEVIRQVKGGVTSTYVRPPYGAYNSTVKAAIESLQMRVCIWTFDTNDWKGYSASAICTNVVNNAPKGAVILMHLQHKAATASALGCIVKGLRAKGHKICRPYSATHPGQATPVRMTTLPC